MAYTKEYLLDLLAQAESKLGRLPSRREMQKHFGVTEKPFVREFHSWEEAKSHYVALQNADNDELTISTDLDEDLLYGDIVEAQQAQTEIDRALFDYGFFSGEHSVMSLSDLEVPYANLGMINAAVKAAHRAGARIVVLNGDITHSDFFSKHAKTAYIPPIEEYRQLEQLIAFLSKKFDLVIVTRGNHDDMVERFCQRHFGMEHMKFLVRPDLLQNVADRFENVHYAKHWYTAIGDAVYGHPYTYSVVPMRTAIESAKSVMRFRDFKAYFIGHTHQVGSIMVDGVMYTETGCSCNLQSYAFKRIQKTRWVNAYNLASFHKGQIDINSIRNIVHGIASV